MNLGNEHDGPWEMAGKEEPEPVAPYCSGPGHRFEWTEDGSWLELVEVCPDCADGPIRNHWRLRLPDGVDL